MKTTTYLLLTCALLLSCSAFNSENSTNIAGFERMIFTLRSSNTGDGYKLVPPDQRDVYLLLENTDKHTALFGYDRCNSFAISVSIDGHDIIGNKIISHTEMGCPYDTEEWPIQHLVGTNHYRFTTNGALYITNQSGTYLFKTDFYDNINVNPLTRTTWVFESSTDSLVTPITLKEPIHLSLLNDRSFQVGKPCINDGSEVRGCYYEYGFWGIKDHNIQFYSVSGIYGHKFSFLRTTSEATYLEKNGRLKFHSDYDDNSYHFLPLH